MITDHAFVISKKHWKVHILNLGVWLTQHNYLKPVASAASCKFDRTTQLGGLTHNDDQLENMRGGISTLTVEKL